MDDLLARLPRNARLIFLGDYIDRGPDSKGVIERLMAEKHRGIFLRGNHEQMLLDYFQKTDDPHSQNWLRGVNGGWHTLHSYGLEPDAVYEDLPESHRTFLEALPLYYEGEDFIAVHAGVNVDIPRLEDQAADDLLYIRNRWLASEAQWRGKHVVFGHTPARYVHGRERQHEPLAGKKSTGIDTGCVYGGSLTALHLATRALVQVKALRAYA